MATRRLSNKIPILIVGLGLFLILFSQLSGSVNTGSSILGSDKTKVDCIVILKDPIFGEPYILSHQCETSGGCGLFGVLGFFEPEIAYNKGTIKLTTTSDTKSVKYSTWKLGAEEQYDISVCTSDSSGSLKVYDETGNVLDSKGVTW